MIGFGVCDFGFGMGHLLKEIPNCLASVFSKKQYEKNPYQFIFNDAYLPAI